MRTTRLLAFAGILTLVLVGTATQARADVDVDVRGGVYADAEGPFVGAGILTPFGSSRQWFFNPNAEAAFGDSVDVLSANFDVHYDFPTDTAWTIWMGAGPALIDRNFDGPPPDGQDDMDLGANFLVGAGARKGDYRPFLQGKVTVADDSEFVFAAGLRF